MNGRSRSAGQSLVEFALIVPFILLIVFLFIDFARILYFYSALQNAVREGARYAVVTPYSADWITEIENRITKYAVAMPDDDIVATVTCNTTSSTHSPPCNEDTDVSVTVLATITVSPMTPFWTDSFDISAESTMIMTPYGKYTP